MDKTSEDNIKFKIAIALRVLHSRNKANPKEIANKKEQINSYEKIALNISGDMRKATVTSAFDGQTKSTMVTIILIIESMGYTISQFGEEYDKITDEDISAFKKEIIKKKGKTS